MTDVTAEIVGSLHPESQPWPARPLADEGGVDVACVGKCEPEGRRLACPSRQSMVRTPLNLRLRSW
jgi:hypothetical protein